jgi:hypothetical protein
MEHCRAASGKEIEELVATIEALPLPRGFTVTKNTRVYNDHGVQAAELDVEIRGKLGSADIAWLMECRNRPREGPAPGAWIEQLMGRRDRFNFNKVTAVSTTGFTEGANRPIVDMTGIKGFFDITLDWTPGTAHPGPNVGVLRCSPRFWSNWD